MDAQSMPPANEMRLRLDAGPGGAVPVCAPLPAGPCSFPDILPAVRAVTDALQIKSRADLSGLGRAVRCGPGCDACCRHLVVLGQAEAVALLAEVERLPERRQAKVLARFRSTLERLESSGLLPRLLAVYTREAHDWRRTAEVQAAYWELALPCPLLEGGACSIYQARPLVCRQHAVTSAPEACQTPFAPGAGLEKVLPAYDLAGAAAAFDGRLAHGSRVLPLTLCLLRRGTLERASFPVDEPRAMLLRFLDFAAGHYARRDRP